MRLAAARGSSRGSNTEEEDADLGARGRHCRRGGVRPHRRAFPGTQDPAPDLRPARRARPDPRLDPRGVGGGGAGRGRSAQPVPCALVQRRRSQFTGRPPRARRAGERAHRGGRTDRRGFRRPFPDDPRPQGARRLRLPRATRRHRPVRPHLPPGGVALHRQLLPRRGGDLGPHELPGCRGAAGGDEPRTLRLARELGRRPGGRDRDPRHRVQREGDLRQVRRAVARSRQRHLQPVRRVREPPRALPVHWVGPRRRLRRAARPGSRAAAGRLRLSLGLGGDARRR